MKQELYIKGEVVSYTLLTKHITAVLGRLTSTVFLRLRMCFGLFIAVCCVLAV